MENQEERRQIMKQLDSLEEETSRLAKNLDNLFGRIDPLIRPSNKNKGDDEKAMSEMCKLAIDISEKVDRIRGFNTIIEDKIARIEI